MDFSFIHAADLHLGSPFLGLASDDRELAKRVASASREAFEDLVSEAIDRQVQFMLIAGDIYDGDWRDTTIGHFFNRQMSRLDRAQIPVFQVKGNHDAESVITSAITLPASVKTFPAQKADTFRIPELNVAIHGQSFAERSVSENLVLKYPKAEPGWFNIGVLHTSCDGRPGHATYAPCELGQLLQRGYQYWALGHVHNYEVLNEHPPVIFPGNLQGRHINERGPKGAVLVEVSDGEVRTHSRLLLDRIRWAAIRVDLTGIAKDAEAFVTIRKAIQQEVTDAGSIPIVFRMTLTGSTPLNRSLRVDRQRINDEVVAAANHCTELIWLESLKITTLEPSTQAPQPGSPLANLDFKVLLDLLAGSAEVDREAREAMELIKGKFPSMNIPEDLFSEEGIASMVQEARETLVASSVGSEVREA
jgi:DNA repair exonuclease SbcCD nuclease subunit